MANSIRGHALENANVARLLGSSAACDPARPAIVEDGCTTPYGALYDRAMAITRALVEDGVGAGEPVAILLERGAEAAAAFFGVVAAGAVAVVIQETLRARQIDHILEHSRARCVLTTPERLAALPRPIESPVRILDLQTLPRVGDVRVPAPRPPEALAQIVYTSGSTGAPKGVMVTHGNLLAVTAAVTHYLELGPEDRLASLLPFNFVYGMSQLLCAVSAGATLVIERSSLPREIVGTLQRERVSVVAAIPPLWRRLLQEGGLATAELPALRVLTNAGGHLPVDTVRALRRARPAARLYLMYGLTEVLRSTYLPAEEVDAHPDSIGRAIPGAEVILVDDDGEVVDGAGTGELVHRGPTVTLGYWRDPVLTAATFRPDPRHGRGGERVVFSGDLVRRDDAGLLYYIGRRDRLIKTMGCRVGPDEVLEVLYASGEVAEAEVIGEPDVLWGTRIAAYVVLAPGGSPGRLSAYCTTELPRHMRPARFELLDALPLLPSGKHDLGALRQAVAP